MKKVIAIAFLVSLIATPVLAADTFTEEVIGGGETISVLSKNVTAKVVSNVTAFAAATAHLNGGKQFGVTSTSTSIYATAFTAGDLSTLVAPSVSDTTSFANWDTL